MQHQPLQSKSLTMDVNVAAVWPSFEEALVNRQALDVEARTDKPAEAAPVASPTPAAPDVPAAVGGFVAASYAALILVFFAFFAGSPLAFFSITVCALFVGIYFAVPRIFFAVEADRSRRPTLYRFWHEGMQTLTGRSSGKDAMIQMMIVPVFLAFGLLAMGIMGRIFIG